MITFHCSTWSMELRYFKLHASTMNPSTIFTRASQPPLRGSRCMKAGNKARTKNGDASPDAKVIMPSAG